MFLPETEDMLPRAAPRPCTAVPLGHVDEIVKPTVPEVSILFGEPLQQQQAQIQQPQQQQSASAQRPLSNFATWKKQILPRVNFSPVLVTELGPGSPPATSSAGNDYNYLPRARFNEERTTPPRNMNVGYAAPGPYATDHLGSAQRLPNQSDVLTICASTQTETDSIRLDAKLDLSNLAEKKDIREVLALLEMMRQDQQQLRRLCESLAQQQEKQQQLPTQSPKTYKETASQCDLMVSSKSNSTVKRITPTVQDYIVEEEDEELPAVIYELPARMNPKFQSPRAAPPIAQSTGYRVNTPKAKLAPGVLPKPSTEQSMVMNELALKYLPQRQIHELMDELHVSPKATATTPLRPIDNFVSSPSNMSNASYKYLKKYRLLPEEQLGYEQHHQSPQGIPKMPQQKVCQEQMLDLDNIRNQPKLI
ncbi:SCL-interrupting locus protein homolog [Drosophila grimshawi]|uniref:GH22691 n=1 Tax=Drosophila grimshawi TaxID=7222 RepID=B4JVE1_DROGR|nr:SCL-interrupting locus protein homolog [Drosophila grimshawi]EDV98409.1 GH22691 [Drosophila grimshawi]